MDSYDCPLDGCDYSAESPSSVEAHISGKRDDVHRGEFGQNLREEIGSEENEKPTIDEDDRADGADVFVEDDRGEETTDSASVEEGGSGVWFPAVSTGQIIGLLVVVFLVAAYLRSRSSADQTEDQQVEDDETDETASSQEVSLYE